MSNTSDTTPEVDAIIFSPEGYNGFVRSLFNRSGDFSKDFTHAVLGLRTECYELLEATDRVNAIEEGGDLMFYSEALGQVTEDFDPLPLKPGEEEEAYVGHPAVVFAATHTAAQTMDYCLNQLEDVAKRWVGYGKVPGVSALNLQILGVMAMTSALQASVLRTRVVEPSFDLLLLRANVAKLLKRYQGTKFDAERAVNRDVAAERVVLENAAQA